MYYIICIFLSLTLPLQVLFLLFHVVALLSTLLLRYLCLSVFEVVLFVLSELLSDEVAPKHVANLE